ncbi:hypothetical protein MKL29_06760 [Streptococcus suis]|nr:hypothetical protein [Streptococcus suis]
MKKKVRYLTLLVAFIVALSACSKSPKAVFKERLEALQSATKSSYHYQVKVNDLTAGSAPEAAVDVKKLVGKTVEATISQDLSKHLVGISVNLSAMDPKFSDVNMVYKDDKAYMSVEPLLAINGVDLADAKGKFVDVAELSGEKMPSLKELTPEKEVDLSWLDEVDDKHFKEDGESVSVTLTMDQLLKLYQSVLTQMDDDKESAEQLETYLNLAKASLSDKSKAVLSLDKKSNLKTKLSLIYAKGLDSLVTSVDLDIDAKKVAYKTPVVPNESDVLSKKELESMFMGQQKLSDEDFNNLYEGMKAQSGQMSQEEIADFLEGAKPYLTDEQIKKMETLAKDAAA